MKSQKRSVRDALLVCQWVSELVTLAIFPASGQVTVYQNVAGLTSDRHALFNL